MPAYKYGKMARHFRILFALVTAILLLTHVRWAWNSSSDSKFEHQSEASDLSDYDHKNRLSYAQEEDLATHRAASSNVLEIAKNKSAIVSGRDPAYPEDKEYWPDKHFHGQYWLTNKRRKFDVSLGENRVLKSTDPRSPELNRRVDTYGGLHDTNDKQLPWDQAVKVGNNLIALINGPIECIKPSKWTNVDDLTAYGWTQAVDRAIELQEPFKSIWSALGIPLTDVRRIEWKHNKQSAHTGPEGTIYQPTGARYNNIYCKQIIIGDFNFGPDTMGGRKSPPMVGAEIVPLKQWSDVTFLQYWEYCKQHSTETSTFEACLKDLRGIIRANVVSAKTRDIANEALQKSGKVLATWDKRATWTIDEEAAQALLATPNGQGVAWFLAQHKAQLGRKVVTEVSMFSKPEGLSGNLNLFFKIEDHPSAAEKPSHAQEES
ncbi:hypothetical protein KC343_g1388 [Hortaea werneckii]|uniref:Uncharacterized protein n=1 Tax=Hortaea werneckii TaxID=91943 RepID=A0A3M7HEX6_HORWE|nr:hypothetical protein KC323_g3965 [Hortaea werneckii]KAI7280517.1 hypothetical protein KC352_g6711 [Hortaea werneckii]KAI7349376.1 hypothetical protein KC320_g6061 [Hortaea werneckii]KAI7572174.1 hypothetical protein KC317_g989 [Hortaea werneckii]KAI7627178.1 hypothetical protein KC346_g882 [Hortaea werneckii]